MTLKDYLAILGAFVIGGAVGYFLIPHPTKTDTRIVERIDSTAVKGWELRYDSLFANLSQQERRVRSTAKERDAALTRITSFSHSLDSLKLELARGDSTLQDWVASAERDTSMRDTTMIRVGDTTYAFPESRSVHVAQWYSFYLNTFGLDFHAGPTSVYHTISDTSRTVTIQTPGGLPSWQWLVIPSLVAAVITALFIKR